MSTQHKVSDFTELFLIGTPAEVAVLTNLAKNSGTLVYRSAPTPMGGTDRRVRVYLRLLFIP